MEEKERRDSDRLILLCLVAYALCKRYAKACAPGPYANNLDRLTERDLFVPQLGQLTFTLSSLASAKTTMITTRYFVAANNADRSFSRIFTLNPSGTLSHDTVEMTLKRIASDRKVIAFNNHFGTISTSLRRHHEYLFRLGILSASQGEKNCNAKRNNLAGRSYLRGIDA